MPRCGDRRGANLCNNAQSPPGDAASTREIASASLHTECSFWVFSPEPEPARFDNAGTCPIGEFLSCGLARGNTRIWSAAGLKLGIRVPRGICDATRCVFATPSFHAVQSGQRESNLLRYASPYFRGCLRILDPKYEQRLPLHAGQFTRSKWYRVDAVISPHR